MLADKLVFCVQAMGETRNLSVDKEGFVQHLNCRLFHLATVCTSSWGWLGLSGQSLGHYHCWSPSSTTRGQPSSQGVTLASKPFRFQLIFGTWQTPRYVEGIWQVKGEVPVHLIGVCTYTMLGVYLKRKWWCHCLLISSRAFNKISYQPTMKTWQVSTLHCAHL